MDEDQFSDDGSLGLNSLREENFPDKVKMTKSHSQIKEFIPSLELKKTISAFSDKIIYEEKTSQMPLFFNTIEWQMILRKVSLTQDDINRLINNKIASKLINAFELLSNLINEKNSQIDNLDKDLQSILSMNKEVTNENLKLINIINHMLKESSEHKISYKNFISLNDYEFSHLHQNLDESIAGNSSKLVMQYLNTTINNNEESRYERFKIGLIIILMKLA